MAFKAGDVVLVPVPYRDRPGESSRPGVVVSGQGYNQSGDVIIAAVTSHPREAPWIIPFKTGLLPA